MILMSQNKNIVILYMIFIASVLMNFIPSMVIQSWGGILFFISFIATYISKFKAEKGSIKHTHYSYIIKTIWIFSLFTFIGIVLAYALGDHTTINILTADFQSGRIPSNQEMTDALIKYGMENITLFLIIFLPIMLHVLYRLGNGLLLARSNKLPSLKSWI